MRLKPFTNNGSNACALHISRSRAATTSTLDEARVLGYSDGNERIPFHEEPHSIVKVHYQV